MAVTNKTTTHETWNFHFRKKFKALSALAVVAAPGTLIYDPPPTRVFKVARVYVRIHRVVGTVTTPPQIKLTNGTNDITAATAITPATDGNVQEIAVTVNANTKIDADNPLRLVQTVAQVGGTVYLYDVIVDLIKISD